MHPVSSHVGLINLPKHCDCLLSRFDGVMVRYILVVHVFEQYSALSASLGC